MYYFFSSLISFIIAILIILAGIVGIMVPWSISIQSFLVQMIIDDALAISLFGFALVVIGVAIAAYIILNSKKRYYHIKTSDGSVLVDKGIIEDYLKIYWKELMPEAQISSGVTLKNNRVNINVDLPYVPLEGQRPLLEKIRTDIKDWMFKFLGYRDEFTIHASFQKK